MDENKNIPEKNPQKNVVRSIFDRQSERTQHSSVFGEKEKKETNSSSIEEFAVAKQAPRLLSGEEVDRINRKFKRQLPIGVDIGFDSIKVAQLAVVDDQLRIVGLGVCDIPAEIKGGISKKEQIAQLLGDLLRDTGMKGDVYSAIQGDNMNFKYVSLPRMPRKEVHQAIEWEFKQLAGDSFDSQTYDYTILNEEALEQADRIQILLISCPKQVVTDHLSIFDMLGLRVLAVETDTFSLLACLNFNKRIQPKEVVLLLDLGGTSSSISVINNQVLEYTRKSNVTGDTFISALKDERAISFEQAQDMIKQYYAQEKEGQQHIKKALTFPLEKLAKDIENSFKHYSFQITRSLITDYHKIILCGGLVSLPLVAPFLKERLGKKVEINNPFSVFEVKEGVHLNPSFLEEDRGRFSVAMGLALRAVEEGTSL